MEFLFGLSVDELYDDDSAFYIFIFLALFHFSCSFLLLFLFPLFSSFFLFFFPFLSYISLRNGFWLLGGKTQMGKRAFTQHWAGSKDSIPRHKYDGHAILDG